MAHDPHLQAHRDWIGYLQQVGLVVSAPALLAGQAYLNPHQIEEQQRFRSQVKTQDVAAQPEPIHFVSNFVKFVQEVLGWQADDMVSGNDPSVSDLTVSLPAFEAILSPSYVVKEFRPGPVVSPWLMLVQEYPLSTPFDEPWEDPQSSWLVSPQTRMERLLQKTGVRIGLLFNGVSFRLVSYMGETPGHLTFPVHAMMDVAGRPIFAAFTMLLGAHRLFHAAAPLRLPALLAESRKYQNLVSTQLAEQVLFALYELVRGVQGAHDLSQGELLKELLRDDPNQIYFGLLTVLMRLVFVLYAEDRGLMSNDPVYLKYYSITGLYERLQEDAGRYPDTMDQRYGAWAQLLALFRLVHSGAKHSGFVLPAREGYLFDPDRFKFLEGRLSPLSSGGRGVGGEGGTTRNQNTISVHPQESAKGDEEPSTPAGPVAASSARRKRQVEPLTPSPSPSGGEGSQTGSHLDLPLISDGCLFRVLRHLLIIDGERISYSALDVEQIGSVYEAIMGFRLERALGPSIAIKAKKTHGAATTINLDALLRQKPAERAKWMKEQTDQELTGAAAKELKEASSLEDLLGALEKKVARPVTPEMVPVGAMVLQPSDERRRSGSHYTPRALTMPIVKKALEPVLAQLGEKPTPEAILNLKVCDPAMGSGAFLVEACRQLGEHLTTAWAAHHASPTIPADENELLHAMRLVAQRCLYGVDKNPMAVDLAKLSLWLATLARDHAFTFLDHALRCGDSLVGLSKLQIINFHWLPTPVAAVAQRVIEDRLNAVFKVRQDIITAGDDYPFELKVQKLKKADEDLQLVRFAGNLVVAGFFAGKNDKERKLKRDAFLQHFDESLRTGIRHEEIRSAVSSLLVSHVQPFHWEIEFPEVFSEGVGNRELGVGKKSKPTTSPTPPSPLPTPSLPGFDVIVGNPPFAGKNTIAAGNHPHYLDWLKALHEESHGNADLVAHFFRRAFNLLRTEGTFGLIATNTIAQGDTRGTGLRWICTHGGTIYHAKRRYKWPGLAAVVVSVVHVFKGVGKGNRELGVGNRGQTVSSPTPYSPLPTPLLLDEKPVPIITAYLFHAGGHDDPARLEANAGKSFQGSITYGMGFTFADDDNDATPIATMNQLIKTDKRNKDVIFPFIGGEEINDDALHQPIRHVIYFGEMNLKEASRWPDLLNILEEKVKPDRATKAKEVAAWPWWQFWRIRSELYLSLLGKGTVAVCARHQPHWTVACLPTNVIFSDAVVAFCVFTKSGFMVLQSRLHEVWARFFGSSMKDDLRYTPSDCFETFPFPPGFETDTRLEAVGKEYYEFRAALMVRNNEGLTKTYNRFHDPLEKSADIQKLRELHAAMDRAVLEAYGWKDLQPTCEFLLDYVEEEGSGELGVGSRGKKKPWRYRWPDEFRDEVLARLLELNKVRAEEERLAVEAAAPPAKTKGKRGRKAKDEERGLFGE